jgi:TM2 domain-containing membrane protein YozV
MTCLVTLLLLNTLFFRYSIFFFRQNKVLMNIVVRLCHFLAVLIFLVFTTIFCLAFILYAMFKGVSSRYRTPTRSFMAGLSFAFGSFGDHELLADQYNEAWLIIMILCWFLLTIVFKNMVIAVFVSFIREYMLRENYQYHPFWSQQNPETFNPHEITKRAW